ncbi:MAG: iron chelate uptake ABC transporter family permease subunit, partial [Desulfobacterales bacterium]|nr:iron chelate uptake ABC transporter family permease subunit [Desulfobacterales bacterium]
MGPGFLKRLLLVSVILSILLAGAMYLGISIGSTGSNFGDALRLLLMNKSTDSVLEAIIWRIRLPRVILAALVGATLSLGGLVFQALLRNPLAEPYILGISGGSAIGA